MGTEWGQKGESHGQWRSLGGGMVTGRGAAAWSPLGCAQSAGCQGQTGQVGDRWGRHLAHAIVRQLNVSIGIK